MGSWSIEWGVLMPVMSSDCYKRPALMPSAPNGKWPLARISRFLRITPHSSSAHTVNCCQGWCGLIEFEGCHGTNFVKVVMLRTLWSYHGANFVEVVMVSTLWRLSWCRLCEGCHGANFVKVVMVPTLWSFSQCQLCCNCDSKVGTMRMFVLQHVEPTYW